jgi:hypothetical protein
MATQEGTESMKLWLCMVVVLIAVQAIKHFLPILRQKYPWAIPLIAVIAFVLGAVACPGDSCDNSAGPSPIVAPGPSTNGDDIPQAPDMRQDTEVEFNRVVGVTAFALADRDESYIHSFIQRVLEHGYNTLRVGSETSDWSWPGIPSYLPQGPPIESPEARENVKKLLRVTAAYPNLWIQLISSFTIKEGSFARQKNWARFVASKSQGYKHVFVSAMNEPHQSSYTHGEIIELLKILKTSGRPVGVDYQAEPGHWRYPSDVARYCDYLDMHPRRNPDLSLDELRHVAGLNGLVLLSETTSYASEENIRHWPRLGNHSNIYLDGHGTEEDRKRAARQYMERVRQVQRLRWFFHSIDLIRCETLDFWMPRWE